MMFDEEGAKKLDDKISTLISKITKLLKSSEQMLKEM